MKLHINQANDPHQASFPKSATCIDGIYIHIPFCTHKCHYCDFYSLTTEMDEREKFMSFIESLLQELDFYLENVDLSCDSRLKIKTLFIGGGTPSMLDEGSLAHMFEGLASRGILSEIQEMTMEMNPETVSQKKIKIFREWGGNRISMGVQSFNPQHLKTLERLHTPDSIHEKVEMARQLGIENINLDFIFAIPGQTLQELENDLQMALSQDPDHLSCYSLIFEPGTALEKRRELGQIKPVANELEAQMYELVMSRLNDQYEHYEISNWARKKHESQQSHYRCQHNMIYWQYKNWLGLGPGAGTHLDGWQWKNQPQLTDYVSRRADERPRILELEMPDSKRQLADRIMMGMRLKEGIAIAIADELNPTQKIKLDEYIKQGWMCYAPAGNTPLMPAGNTPLMPAGNTPLMPAGHATYSEGTNLRFTKTGRLLADRLLADWLF